ncbi:hypothetical protein HII17_14660 [Thalassotalea sp. M1531]|uniref:Uncharacterized protein n=1 Tax=Thalassotalea algicola TaxID=2716224 RepID=A0A7Y0Q939_9GAMM|nr:DUF6746 family protein [Thalassotalea algicola]NMP32795.1 hypothetical protein [Thalassotalea algicola]
MKIITTVFTSLTLVVSTAQADEKYSHFPSLESPNTPVALCNLLKFKEKLQTIVSKKTLTPEDMVKVHELTYTLENAVIRLRTDLATIAVDLEKVHLASEHLDKETIKASGEKYLTATNLLLASPKCG